MVDLAFVDYALRVSLVFEGLVGLSGAVLFWVGSEVLAGSVWPLRSVVGIVAR